MKQHKLFPLVDNAHFIGALMTRSKVTSIPRASPTLCESCAQSRRGVYRFTRVTDLVQRAGRIVGRDHRQGRLVAEHASTPGGWAREVGRLRRSRAADARDGAPVLITGEIPESSPSAKEMLHVDRLRRRDLHAPGRPRHAARHLREGRRAVGRARDAVEFHARAAAARSRPHRAQPRSRLPRTFRRSSAPASSASSTARSRSRPTAIR